MTVRSQYAFVFSFGGVLAIYGTVRANTVFSLIVLANIAIASFGVGLAFLLKKFGTFLKIKNGRFSLPGYLVFWPYFVLNHVIMGLYRLLSHEHPIDEVIPGLYLGAKLWSFDKEKLTQRDISAVVDVTAEWGESS